MITRAAFACHDGGKSDGICFEPQSLNQLAGTHFDIFGVPIPFAGTNGAVGAPDTPPPEGSEAHCDDADFLNVPGYPQSRADATAALQGCVNHLRSRFALGLNSAEALLDDKNQVRRSQVDFSDENGGSCTFTFDVQFLGRAKCNAIEGLGRSLHGVQDFYSHSNWADSATAPFTPENPPGLARTESASFLDLRAQNAISAEVPLDLSTGCYALGQDDTPGKGSCTGRITHNTLNKDHGLIDPATGATSSPGPGTPRSSFPGNFNAAVQAAIQDSRRQWKLFREELRLRYGAERGNLMICALVRDDPLKDCHNRKVGIVVDSSGSNTNTDPSNLRIDAARAFNNMLTTQDKAGPDGLPDKVTVIDFDDTARIVYPLGDPSGASFDGIDSSGGTDIGSGISLALDELTKDDPDLFKKRTGMIVLTDGEDGSPLNQLAQLARAKLNGVRVNFGFLSPPAIPVPRSVKRSMLAKRAPSEDLLLAILETGGTFGTIDSAAAQKNFIDLIVSRGVTDLDGSGDSTTLLPGVTVADYLSPALLTRSFVYRAKAGEKLNFIVTPTTGGVSLKATLHDIRQNIDVNSVDTSGVVQSSIPYDAASDADLELIVTAGVTGKTVFSVGLKTNIPIGNTTTTNPANSTTPTPSSGHSTQLSPNSSTTYLAGNHTPATTLPSLSTTNEIITILSVYPTSTSLVSLKPYITNLNHTCRPTSSITYCLMTTTITDSTTTHVITTSGYSTITYLTTITLPCSHCTGGSPHPTLPSAPEGPAPTASSPTSNQAVTVLTTYSLTNCPITLTYADFTTTHIIKTSGYSTVSYLTTVTIPCSHCGGGSTVSSHFAGESVGVYPSYTSLPTNYPQPSYSPVTSPITVKVNGTQTLPATPQFTGGGAPQTRFSRILLAALSFTLLHLII